MNLYSLGRQFPTEESALAHLIKVRWPNGVCCLSCGYGKCWLVESTGKTGKPRRLFQCTACKFQFSATQGTLFHDSHLPLTKWFAAIALMADAKKGMSACQLQRHIGMTYKTAWYVCHRIREAMQEPEDYKIGGESKTVEIDETYIGGVKRHVDTRTAQLSKALVLGMAERKGRLLLRPIADRSVKSLKPAVESSLDPNTKEIITDSHAAYPRFIPKDKHRETSHKEELRDRSWTSTQTVENAFSLFKRGIIGNYHQLSPWHLERYMKEFCWRYNRRGAQPWIFGMALNNMVCHKPLSYKELIKF